LAKLPPLLGSEDTAISGSDSDLDVGHSDRLIVD